MASGCRWEAVVLLPCLIGTLAGVGSAQVRDDNQYARQVREQLRRASATFERQGFELTQSVYTGSLDDGESESLTLTLPFRPGGYRLVGVCDADCDDLDLVLLDLYGDTVDEDLEPDDVPLLVVTANGEHRYRLRVSMASCASSPCWYGIGVFGRIRR